MNEQTAAASLDDYRWLTSAQAAKWLELADSLGEDLLAAASALRANLSAPRAHLVLEQRELRRRARTKFTLAARMFFTAAGLEQATDEIVAAHKAARFPAVGPLADFCCGMGGDLMALARRGQAVGFDRDPVAATLAQANCRAVLGADEATARRAQVVVAEVEPSALHGVAAWHIDPDRRSRGRRTTRVEYYEPGPEQIDRLLERQPSAAVKLAPAAEVPQAWSPRAELEWIGRHRQCRQLVAWFGELAKHPGLRRATVLGKTSQECRTFTGMPGEFPPIAAGVQRYVFEPDAAVLAANLAGALAAEHGLSALAPDVAYLTGDHPIADAALSAFEVDEVLPYDLKRLRALVRLRGIGRLEVKKRGVTDDPEKVRRQLKMPGDQSATLLLARAGRKTLAILARRLENARPVDEQTHGRTL